MHADKAMVNDMQSLNGAVSNLLSEMNSLKRELETIGQTFERIKLVELNCPPLPPSNHPANGYT